MRTTSFCRPITCRGSTSRGAGHTCQQAAGCSGMCSGSNWHMQRTSECSKQWLACHACACALTGSVRCACASAHRSRQNSSSAEEPSRLRSDAACGQGLVGAYGQARGGAEGRGKVQQPSNQPAVLVHPPRSILQPPPPTLTTTLRRCPSPSASPLSRRSDSTRRASVSSSFRLLHAQWRVGRGSRVGSMMEATGRPCLSRSTPQLQCKHALNPLLTTQTACGRWHLLSTVLPGKCALACRQGWRRQ